MEHQRCLVLSALHLALSWHFRNVPFVEEQPPAQEEGSKVDVFSSLPASWPQALQQVPQMLEEDDGLGKGVFQQVRSSVCLSLLEQVRGVG